MDGLDYTVTGNTFAVATAPSGFIGVEGQPEGGFTAMFVYGFDALITDVMIDGNTVQGAGGPVHFGIDVSDAADVAVTNNVIDGVVVGINAYAFALGLNDLDPPLTITGNAITNSETASCSTLIRWTPPRRPSRRRAATSPTSCAGRRAATRWMASTATTR